MSKRDRGGDRALELVTGEKIELGSGGDRREALSPYCPSKLEAHARPGRFLSVPCQPGLQSESRLLQRNSASKNPNQPVKQTWGLLAFEEVVAIRSLK